MTHSLATRTNKDINEENLHVCFASICLRVLYPFSRVCITQSKSRSTAGWGHRTDPDRKLALVEHSCHLDVLMQHGHSSYMRAEHVLD
jgi:hypothetical protein